MLEFTCVNCGKPVQGDDALAGKCVQCPLCNLAMTAPGVSPATAITASGPSRHVVSVPCKQAFCVEERPPGAGGVAA